MSLNLCVFCGSSAGTDPAYEAAARTLGRAIAEREWNLIYGAGSTGMMGAVGKAALDAGAEVIGVIPKFLTDWEPPLDGLTELIYVDTMAERKIVMSKLSDAFLSLPGGIGTMDEFFEMWTLEALKIHEAPSALLDVNNYFQPLLKLADHMTDTGFVRGAWREQIITGTDVDQILDELERAVNKTAKTRQSP